MSPYIFLLCSEGLNRMLQQAVSNDRIRGFSSCKRGPKISHLFFTNDSLLFCKASLIDLQAIQDILSLYEQASGQKLNREKGWKEKLLSQAGREILLKAVVQAIPTFAMGCFKLLVGLCQEIEALIQKFFWGQKGE